MGRKRHLQVNMIQHVDTIEAALFHLYECWNAVSTWTEVILANVSMACGKIKEECFLLE
jgi:hypothetical protein